MTHTNADILIEAASADEEFVKSAQMLSKNEPWISLGRGYEYSLQKVRNPAGELYVAKVDGNVAGCVYLEMFGQLKGFIRSICVDSSYRGKGIGSELMRFAEKRIFSETANAFIFVSSTNPGAQRLYLRLGYEKAGHFKDYIEPGMDEILLRKTLGPSNHFKGRQAEGD